MKHSGPLVVRQIGATHDEFAIDLNPEGSVRVEPGGVFTATQVDRHTYRVTKDEAASLILAVRDRGVVWVFSNGDVWMVEVATRQNARRAARDGVDASLSAPMPATVVRVPVEVGQSVAQGDTLILLEAMKMELSIRAPRAGRVTAVHCHAGDLVQPGVALLDLE